MGPKFLFYPCMNQWIVALGWIVWIASCSQSLERQDRNFQIPEDPRVKNYFQEDYYSGRKRFLKALDTFSQEARKHPQAKDVKIRREEVRIPSKDKDNNYITDYVVLDGISIQSPPNHLKDFSHLQSTFQDSKLQQPRLVIINSGIHGAEAFTGSALQAHFLEEVALRDLDWRRTKVLLIHAFNPWGYANGRRVTENNVDLNRNFGATKEIFQIKNEGYTQIYSLLNPEGPADSTTMGNRFFFLKAVYNILRKGMPALRQAALQGQYEYPKGIYFGGQEFEPHREPLERILRRESQGVQKVLFIDLHTGYGERGTLHLFPSDPKDEFIKRRTEEIFTGYKIDWASSDDFYTVTGELSTHVCRVLSKIQDCVPMVFEYGTLNSQTTGGAVESIHRLILENQGYQNGYVNDEEKAKIRTNFRDMFYPYSPLWRSKVLNDTERIWRDILPKF